MYWVMSVFGAVSTYGQPTISALPVAISAERNGSTWTTASSCPFSSGSFICGNGTSEKRTLVRSTPCLSSSATAWSQAVLLMTLTATRLPSSSLSDVIEPFFTITAVVVSGGDVRTIAPGASTTASSPCSIAWNVETVLLSTISSRPDC